MIVWIVRCLSDHGRDLGHHTVCVEQAPHGRHHEYYVNARGSLRHQDPEHDWRHSWFDLPSSHDLFVWDEEG